MSMQLLPIDPSEPVIPPVLSRQFIPSQPLAPHVPRGLLEVQLRVFTMSLMELYLARRRWDRSRGLLPHIFRSFRYGETKIYEHMSTEAQSLLLEAYEVYTSRPHEQIRPPTDQPSPSPDSTRPSDLLT
ncbi:hypothetical protein RJT34_12844 [Clitoria ternatea]|uniref:Uncharacterized protein n=1 Tax=Clitoria ternatea TaxID=43366 RepID=A0AAN9PLT2_CLITE